MNKSQKCVFLHHEAQTHRCEARFVHTVHVRFGFWLNFPFECFVADGTIKDGLRGGKETS